MSDTTFDLEDAVINEDSPETVTGTKAYEAQYRRQDGGIETRYFDGERLIDAATKASDLVSDDPFNTLVSVKELGPIN